MLICSYCGGRVVRDNRRGMYVHAENGHSLPRTSPGDFATDGHRRGQRVGTYDIVKANVRDYMVRCVRAFSDDLLSLQLPYSLPTRRGRWTIRSYRRA